MNSTPNTILWFRAFCGLLSLLYLAVAGLGIGILVTPPEELGMEPMQSTVFGSMVIVLGILFFLPTLLGQSLPPRPGAWVIGFALILMGVTTVILVPLSLPLLHFWKKPALQAWFGRNVS